MLKRLVLVAMSSALSGVATAQQPPAPAASFGARESVHDINISPDGTKVVYIAPAPGAASVVFVSDLAGGEPKPIMKSSGNPERLSWCGFLSNTRLVCRTRALVDYEGLLVGLSRLSSIDATGGKIVELGERSSFYDERLRQFDGDILDWLPDDGNAVLMMRDHVREVGKTGSRIAREKDGFGVDRVDVRTLETSMVEPAKKSVSSYLTDGRGNVRIMQADRIEGATGQLSSTTSYSYRRTGASRWEEFSSFDSVTEEGMVPVAVDATLDAAYVLKKLAGRFALYRVKLDGSMKTDLAYANDKVDVDDVVRIGRGARVIGVTFAEERRQVVYFDEEYARLAKSLAKAIPNLPLVRFLGSSIDNNKLLVFAGSDADPGRYYTYDKNTRGLNEIMLARPALESATLATMKPVSYPASDGTFIPGYLSLPVGKTAKGLPAIVLPHGGPSARDEWGFDWLTQYLVGQGYAVLQPNYRGSAGYGANWMNQNGFADGEPRSATFRRARSGWSGRASPTRQSWRSLAGRTEATRHSSPARPSPTSTKPSWQSRL